MSNRTGSELVEQLVDETSLQAYGRLCCGAKDAVASDHVMALLRQVSPSALVGAVHDQSLARCVMSGLWLLYGELDLSHDISQTIKTAEGSFWHGIMHRLEQDFWNSKYWYRNVGSHPVIEQLQVDFGSIYPFEYVDLCEQFIEQGDGDGDLITEISVAEWQQLFRYCMNNAAGS